jgi:hypothetical protein
MHMASFDVAAYDSAITQQSGVCDYCAGTRSREYPYIQGCHAVPPSGNSDTSPLCSFPSSISSSPSRNLSPSPSPTFSNTPVAFARLCVCERGLANEEDACSVACGRAGTWKRSARNGAWATSFGSSSPSSYASLWENSSAPEPASSTSKPLYISTSPCTSASASCICICPPPNLTHSISRLCICGNTYSAANNDACSASCARAQAWRILHGERPEKPADSEPDLPPYLPRLEATAPADPLALFLDSLADSFLPPDSSSAPLTPEEQAFDDAFRAAMGLTQTHSRSANERGPAALARKIRPRALTRDRTPRAYIRAKVLLVRKLRLPACLSVSVLRAQRGGAVV